MINILIITFLSYITAIFTMYFNKQNHMFLYTQLYLRILKSNEQVSF